MRSQAMTYDEWFEVITFLIQAAGGNPNELPFDFIAYFEKEWGAMEVARQYLNELTRARKRT